MTTIDLGADTFEKAIEEHDILLVDWWASWCGPCQQFAPVYEAASEQHEDVTFASISTETEQELAGAAGIRSIPTLMAFREGVLVFSQAGALPAPALEELITAVKGLDMVEVHRKVAQQTEHRAEQQKQA
jgi:thioredoxin